MNIDDFDLSRTEWEKLIDEWIFDEEDRAMLRRRLLDGVCFERLAEEFHLSVQRTKARFYSARDRLFKKI